MSIAPPGMEMPPPPPPEAPRSHMFRKNLAKIIAILVVLIAIPTVIMLTSRQSSATAKAPSSATATAPSSATPKAPVSFNGVWKGSTDDGPDDLDGLHAVVKIRDNKIVVNWFIPEVNDTVLFWAGTFPTNTGSTIVSVADAKTNDTSIFASDEKTKKFRYQSGELKFEIEKNGNSRIISLKKD